MGRPEGCSCLKIKSVPFALLVSLLVNPPLPLHNIVPFQPRLVLSLFEHYPWEEHQGGPRTKSGFRIRAGMCSRSCSALWRPLCCEGGVGESEVNGKCGKERERK